MVCVALAASSLLLVRWLGREPEYQGRPLSSWLADMHSGKQEAQQRAIEALNAMGPEAVQYLSGELTKPQSRLQRAADSTSKYIPNFVKAPLRRIFNPSKEVLKKYAALNALRAMGTNGAAAMPALEQVFRERHQGFSYAAAGALGEMGTNAVPLLIAALDDGDYHVRASACEVLTRLNTNAAPAVPRLERIARDEIGPISSLAFYALAQIGPAAVPSLEKLALNTNAVVRGLAIYSLGSIGARAAEAVDSIITATGDPSPEVRWRAVQSLSRMDASSPEISERFVAALDDPDRNVRAAAATALQFRRWVVHRNAKKFYTLLEDESPGVRAAAAEALGRTAELGQEAVPHLEKLCRETNELVRASAQRAIETITNSLKHAEARLQ